MTTARDSRIRGVIYVLLAAGTAAMTLLQTDTAGWGWQKWTVGCIGVFVATLTAWRAYIDQTASRVQPTPGP